MKVMDNEKDDNDDDKRRNCSTDLTSLDFHRCTRNTLSQAQKNNATVGQLAKLGVLDHVQWRRYTMACQG